jgi:hypothetical protein
MAVECCQDNGAEDERPSHHNPQNILTFPSEFMRFTFSRTNVFPPSTVAQIFQPNGFPLKHFTRTAKLSFCIIMLQLCSFAYEALVSMTREKDFLQQFLTSSASQSMCFSTNQQILHNRGTVFQETFAQLLWRCPLMEPEGLLPYSHKTGTDLYCEPD